MSEAFDEQITKLEQEVATAFAFQKKRELGQTINILEDIQEQIEQLLDDNPEEDKVRLQKILREVKTLNHELTVTFSK